MKSNGTWRQRMIDMVLRRKDEHLDGFADIDEPIVLSELQKKLSKDKVNFKGIDEEE